MSYARLGQWGSEVYVYLHVSGWLECCYCRLRVRRGRFRGASTDAMVAHLREHIAAGHVVPDDVIPALLADRDENDAYISMPTPELS